VEQRRRELKK